MKVIATALVMSELTSLSPWRSGWNFMAVSAVDEIGVA